MTNELILTEKELLINFINYGKSINLIYITNSNIEPLVVEFLAEKQFQPQKEQLIIDPCTPPNRS